MIQIFTSRKFKQKMKTAKSGGRKNIGIDFAIYEKVPYTRLITADSQDDNAFNFRRSCIGNMNFKDRTWTNYSIAKILFD